MIAEISGEPFEVLKADLLNVPDVVASDLQAASQATIFDFYYWRGWYGAAFEDNCDIHSFWVDEAFGDSYTFKGVCYDSHGVYLGLFEITEYSKTLYLR